MEARVATDPGNLGVSVGLGLFPVVTLAELFRSEGRPPPYALGLPVVVPGLGPCRTSSDDHPAGKAPMNDMLIRP